MKLSTLLQYMRTRRIYQAIVVDEYGGMVGLSRALKILSKSSLGIFKTNMNHTYQLKLLMLMDPFEFDGKVLVDEVEEMMDVEIDDSDSDTIGGYVFGLLERTPIVGDTVDALGYTLEVTQMQGYRVSRIKVTPLPEEETTEEEHEEA